MRVRSWLVVLHNDFLASPPYGGALMARLIPICRAGLIRRKVPRGILVSRDH
jgi:hypothetical protein